MLFLCRINGSGPVVLNYTGQNCGAYTNSTGSPDLNLPSITISTLNVSRTVQRTVSNIAGNETYSVDWSAPYGVSLKVNPARFDISSGQKQALTVSLNATSNSSAMSFGSISLIGNQGHAVNIPVLVIVKIAPSSNSTDIWVSIIMIVVCKICPLAAIRPRLSYSRVFASFFIVWSNLFILETMWGVESALLDQQQCHLVDMVDDLSKFVNFPHNFCLDKIWHRNHAGPPCTLPTSRLWEKKSLNFTVLPCEISKLASHGKRNTLWSCSWCFVLEHWITKCSIYNSEIIYLFIFLYLRDYLGFTHFVFWSNFGK